MAQFLKKPIIQDGFPKDTEGYEGEIRFGFISGVLRQFVRIKGKWHSLSFGAQATTTVVQEAATSTGTTVQSTSGEFDSLTVGNLRITGDFIGSDSTSISSAILANHPDEAVQAHPDYLKNTGTDTLDGALKITGRTTGAVEHYVLKLVEGASGNPVLWVSNDEDGAYTKKAGFWVAEGATSGRLHVGTDEDDFIIADDGTVTAERLETSDYIQASEYKVTSGSTVVINTSGHYVGGGDIVVDSIDTGQGANEVYPLVTGADASDGSIEYVSGSAQGTTGYKFQVGANSIKDAHLEYNTGQHLGTGDTPQFTRLGLGAAADGTAELLISGSAPTIKLTDTDGGDSPTVSSVSGSLELASTLRIGTPADISMGSANFTSGFGGAGWEMTQLGSDKYHLTLEELTVRGTMNVYELLIQQINTTNGSLLVTESAKIKAVAQDGANAFGEFTIVTDDSTGSHSFENGDVLLMQWANLNGTQQTYYINVTNASYGDANQFWGHVYNSSNTSQWFTDDTETIGKTAARIGNSGGVQDRQGGLYLTSSDSGAPFLQVWDDLNELDGSDWGTSDIIKLRLGQIGGLSFDSVTVPANTYGLFAEDVYLKGKIHADNGYIGDSSNGWTINSGSISNNNFVLDSQNQKLQLGTIDDFDPTTGAGKGLFVGLNGSDYDFILGEQGATTNYLHYDGSEGTVTLKGSIIMPSGNAPVDWRGDWVTATDYELNDVVYFASNSYICIVAHTSNVFATDMVANKWTIFAAAGATGADGAAGAAGASGSSWKSFNVYKNSDSGAPSTPSNTGVVVNNVSDIMTTPPTGWTTTPTTLSGDELTYVSTSMWIQTIPPEGLWTVETSWSSPVQFSGNTGAAGGEGAAGAEGPAGASGDTYKTFFIYNNEAAGYNTAVDNTGVVVNSSGVMSPVPTGWTLTPSTPSVNEFTFMSSSTWVQTDPSNPYTLSNSWSTPVQFSGSQGTSGADGEAGGSLLYNVNQWNTSVVPPHLYASVGVQIAKHTKVIYLSHWNQTHSASIYSLMELEIYDAEFNVVGGNSDNISGDSSTPIVFSDISSGSDGFYWGPNGVMWKHTNTPDGGSGLMTTFLQFPDVGDIEIENLTFRLKIRYQNNDAYGYGGTQLTDKFFLSLGDRIVSWNYNEDIELFFCPNDSANMDVTLMDNSPVGSSQAAENMLNFSDPTLPTDTPGLYMDGTHLGYIADVDGSLTWTTYMDNTGKLELYGNPISGDPGARFKWVPGNGVDEDTELIINADVSIGPADGGDVIINGYAQGSSAISQSNTDPDVNSPLNERKISIGDFTLNDMGFPVDSDTSARRGLNLFVYNVSTKTIRHNETFDVWDATHGPNNRQLLKEYLRTTDGAGAVVNLSDGSPISESDLVIITSRTYTKFTQNEDIYSNNQDNVTGTLSDANGLKAQLLDYGATFPHLHGEGHDTWNGSFAFYQLWHNPYVLVGQKGIGEGNGFESNIASYEKDLSTYPDTGYPKTQSLARVYFSVINGQLFGGTTTYGTRISGSQINTGSILSNNYNGNLVNDHFITQGMKINLDKGKIITPGFHIKESGESYFRGDMTLTDATLEACAITAGDGDFGKVQMGIQVHPEVGITNGVAGIVFEEPDESSLDPTNYWVTFKTSSSNDSWIDFRLGSADEYISYKKESAGVESSVSQLDIVANNIHIGDGALTQDPASIINTLNLASDEVKISGEHIEINGATTFTNFDINDVGESWQTLWEFNPNGPPGERWDDPTAIAEGRADLFTRMGPAATGGVQYTKYIHDGLVDGDGYPYTLAAAPVFVADSDASNGIALRFGGNGDLYNPDGDTFDAFCWNTNGHYWKGHPLGGNAAGDNDQFWYASNENACKDGGWKSQRPYYEEDVLYRIAVRLKTYGVDDGGTATLPNKFTFGFFGEHVNRGPCHWKYNGTNYGCLWSHPNPEYAGIAAGAKNTEIGFEYQTVSFYMKGRIDGDAPAALAHPLHNDPTDPANMWRDQQLGMYDLYRYLGIYIASCGTQTTYTYDAPYSSGNGVYGDCDILIDWIAIQKMGSGVTHIDGDMITSGTINADLVDTTSILAQTMTAADITGGTIQGTTVHSGTLTSNDITAVNSLSGGSISAGILSANYMHTGFLYSSILHNDFSVPRNTAEWANMSGLQPITTSGTTGLIYGKTVHDATADMPTSAVLNFNGIVSTSHHFIFSAFINIDIADSYADLPDVTGIHAEFSCDNGSTWYDLWWSNTISEAFTSESHYKTSVSTNHDHRTFYLGMGLNIYGSGDLSGYLNTTIGSGYAHSVKFRINSSGGNDSWVDDVVMSATLINQT